MTSFFTQLYALHVKNTLLRIRNCQGIILELVIPILFSVFLYYLNASAKTTPVPEWKYFRSEIYQLAAKLAYTPNCPAAASIFDKMPKLSVTALETLRQADKDLDEQKLRMVKFFFEDCQAVPKQLKYQVAVHVRYEDKEIYGATAQLDYEFLFAQETVIRSFAFYWMDRLQLTKTKNISIEFQQMPDLPTLESSRAIFLKYLSFLFGMYFFGLLCCTTQGVVEDKETKIKESMKLMGLSGLVYWLSWLVIGLQIGIVLSAVFVVCTFPQYGAERFLRTNPTLVFCVLVLNAINISTFALVISCFVQKARNSVMIVATVFMASWFGTRLALNYAWTRLYTYVLGTVLPQSGVLIFIKVWFDLEKRSREITLSTIAENATDPHQTALDGILILIINSLFNLLVVWYLDIVNPGEYGVPQPYNFCVTKDYWCPVPETADDITDLPKQDDNLFEPPPRDLKPGVMVRGLVKVFGSHVAVAGTSMDLYEDQISVLLGHNGAGKTTTISMITGFLKPTSGTAIVNGYDITKNLAQARACLGLCPQHDILFGKLNCKEHLVFYLRLRGQYKSTPKGEIEEMLTKVGLKEKMTTYSKSLSGGQKRKLSVACSFIGGSKTVFLDEPSSGLDPSARRELWDFLKGMRRERTILLTTHYMDEADVLGDRIMIMAEGVVKCGGTPMFLKQIYGTGYQMNVVKSEKCNSQRLTSLIRKFIPEAKLKGETPNEIYYLLPDEQMHLLPKLFAELEENMDTLHISSFGITATSMEDVFISVGEGRETKPVVAATQKESTVMLTPSPTGRTPSVMSEQLPSPTHTDVHEDYNEENKKKLSVDSERRAQEMARFEAMNKYQKNKGFALFLQQMKAILIKRVILFKRSVVSQLVLLMLPVGFTMLGIKFDMHMQANKESKPMFFSLDRFKDLVVPVFSSPSSDANIVKMYKEQFATSPGVSFVESSATNADNVTEFLLAWGKSNGKQAYEDKMIVGAVIEEHKLIFLHQKTAVHSLGISMQLLANAFVQGVLGADYSITLGIYHDLLKADRMALSIQIGTLFCLGFAMSLVPVIFIYGLIAERAVGAKHLQSLSGVSPMAYWLGVYVFDLFLFTIIIATIMCGFGVNPDLYLARGRWAVTLLILMSFAVAMFPYLYAVQILFKNPASGVSIILTFNIFIGIVAGVMVASLRMTVREGAANYLHLIFAFISPNYVLTSALVTFALTAIALFDKDASVIEYLTKDSAVEQLGPKLLMFTNHFFGGWLLIAIIEFRLDRLLWYTICKDKDPPLANKVDHSEKGLLVEDDDVQAEGLRIKETPIDELCKNNAIVLKNLRKKFRVRCKPFIAVHNSSLALPQNECLGLLGQNGAGKTTTFKMLTGDNMVSSGDAYVKGLSIKTKIKVIHTMMGYCPQFDALHDVLTGTETLYLYARLRGVPESSLNEVTGAIIDFVTLRPHENKLTRTYSGGNKRKLSVGISIIGDPLFIMLDEPTAGMDPVARRTLWTVLHLIRSSGRTLVLTSHSMEECEALCTRIAIMAKGRILCLGSPQHLKNKYGQGYTVVMRASVDEQGTVLPLHEAQVFVLEAFPKTQVFATQEAYVHLQVPDTVPLSKLFDTLETAKEKFKFQFYSVQQTTLEQVFLMFMKDT